MKIWHKYPSKYYHNQRLRDYISGKLAAIPSSNHGNYSKYKFINRCTIEMHLESSTIVSTILSVYDYKPDHLTNHNQPLG